jgi:hypothetical protein
VARSLEAGGATPSVDDLLGNVPGTTDCWASAGCSGHDPGSGTFSGLSGCRLQIL